MILPNSEYDNFLSDELQNLSDIDLRVEKAEYRVIEKYRQRHAIDAPLYFDGTSAGIVMLDGYEENDQGEPDTAEMPDDLVRRLRIVIADVVEHARKHEQTEGIDSESLGERSASYSNLPSLPQRLFRPLDKYDHTRSITGFW
jgi:hypothetical protein